MHAGERSNCTAFIAGHGFIQLAAVYVYSIFPKCLDKNIKTFPIPNKNVCTCSNPTVVITGHGFNQVAAVTVYSGWTAYDAYMVMIWVITMLPWSKNVQLETDFQLLSS